MLSAVCPSSTKRGSSSRGPVQRGRGVVVLHAELPVASVRDIVQQCLTSGRRTGPFAVAAINRIGRSSTCMMTCSPLKDKGDGGGAVLLMEEALPGLSRVDLALLVRSSSGIGLNPVDICDEGRHDQLPAAAAVC
jgi:hypothetical protein